MATGWQVQAVPALQPASRFIIAITNANPVVITTSNDGEVAAAHLYRDGMRVKLNIPHQFGMTEINGRYGVVTVLSDNTFSLPIDSTRMSAFSVPANALGPVGPPSSRLPQFAQSIPIGEITTILFYPFQNTLPSREI